MSAAIRLTSEAQVQALAEHLLDATRTDPVVIVSIPAGASASHVDVDDVAHQVSGHASVYVVPTGRLSWEFSRILPPRTEAYGGACRVYPPGLAWVDDVFLSPLRFVYTAEDGARVGAQLVSDALRMSAAATVTPTALTPVPGARPGAPGAPRPGPRPVATSGTVDGIVGGRALVTLTDGPLAKATISPELIAPDVPAERLLTGGMPVDGLLDVRQGRLDVTPMRLSPADALADYHEGAVIPVLLVHVERELCIARLFPDVEVDLTPAQAFDDTDLDLRTVLTVGETLTALVLSTGPHWRLSLARDPADAVLPAPPILRGGPPWLEPPQVEDTPTPELVTDEAPAPESTDLDIDIAAMVARAIDAHNAAADLVTHSRDATPTHAEKPDESPELAAMRLERDRLLRDLRAAENERASLKDETKRLRTQVREAKIALRHTPSDADLDHDLFGDPGDQLRYEVHLSWARRTTPGEKTTLPIRDWTIGPDFFTTWAAVEGIDRQKVVDVIVDVVTGRVKDIPARHLHQLRSGLGGDDPPVVRSDGATCWRVYLQHKTASARRLHYWQRTDGVVELSSVRLHDDPTP